MRARARAGYTLVELMMIVMIIGVSVLVFTPGFSRAMADRRVSLAARELIRIGRRARADTFGYLRAHLIYIDPGSASVPARIQLLRGPTNVCTLPVWAAARADCGTTDTAANQHRCVENLFLSSISGQSRTISIWEETATGFSATPRALCFQPSGVMRYGTGANITAATANLSDVNISGSAAGQVGGGFIFALLEGAEQPNSANAAQRLHRVLFPMGGSPRSIR